MLIVCFYFVVIVFIIIISKKASFIFATILYDCSPFLLLLNNQVEVIGRTKEIEIFILKEKKNK
jgi:hypothetical protein